VSVILTLIKTIGGPGSAGFFVLVAGLLLLMGRHPRGRRPARVGLSGLVLAYLVLALPVVASALAGGLPATASPGPDALGRVRVLIVFDGDNRAGRLRQTREVLRAITPSDLYLLGDPYLLEDLRALVDPATTTLHDDGSTWNTAAQVDRVRQFVDRWPPLTTALIASRVQMPRIVALFTPSAPDVVLIPSPLDVEPAATGPAAFVPSLAALRASRDAIYEHAALRYTAWQQERQ